VTLTREGLSVSWYSEQGSFLTPSGAVGAARADQPADLSRLRGAWWTPGATRGPGRVIAVVRDSRGGIGWSAQDLWFDGGAP
jgi:hypothetical protein